MNKREVKSTKIVNAYVFFFITYLLLTRFPTFMSIIGEMLNKIISGVFIFGGLLLCIERIIENRIQLKNKYVICLGIWWIITAISTVLNMKYGYIDNVKMLIWMLIQIFICFSFEEYKKNEFTFAINSISASIISLMTLGSIISIVQFLLGVTYQVQIGNSYRWQGFYNQRLYGVFEDPNYAALLAIVALSLSVYYILKTKKRWIKGTNIISIVCNTLYIILSNSRTGIICLLICAVIIGYYKGLKKYRSTDKLAKAIGTFVVSCLLMLAILFTAEKTLGYLPNAIGNIASSEKTEIAQDNENENEIGEDNTNVLERNDYEQDFSNNRLDIWKASAKLANDKYMFGLSPRNISTYANANEPNGYIALTGYETHCGFLSVYVCTGVMGTIIIGLFLILCFKRVINMFMHEKINIFHIVMLMILASYFIFTITLQNVFYMNNASTVIFWRLLGMFVFSENIKEKAEIEL